MSASFASTIDVRSIEPRARHPLIFSTFDALPAGQALLLVNDHDPRPLLAQFEQRCAGAFEWHYLEAGPAQWRVRIGKLGGVSKAAQDSCCSGGACCG